MFLSFFSFDWWLWKQCMLFKPLKERNSRQYAIGAKSSQQQFCKMIQDKHEWTGDPVWHWRLHKANTIDLISFKPSSERTTARNLLMEEREKRKVLNMRKSEYFCYFLSLVNDVHIKKNVLNIIRHRSARYLKPYCLYLFIYIEIQVSSHQSVYRSNCSRINIWQIYVALQHFGLFWIDFKLYEISVESQEA